MINHIHIRRCFLQKGTSISVRRWDTHIARWSFEIWHAITVLKGVRQDIWVQHIPSNIYIPGNFTRCFPHFECSDGSIHQGYISVTPGTITSWVTTKYSWSTWSPWRANVCFWFDVVRLLICIVVHIDGGNAIWAQALISTALVSVL